MKRLKRVILKTQKTYIDFLNLYPIINYSLINVCIVFNSNV